MVGLDPMHARVVKDEFKARSRAGCTIFLSTHTLSVAEEMADRIGIINHGRLIALGTVAELRKTERWRRGAPWKKSSFRLLSTRRISTAHREVGAREPDSTGAAF